MLTSSCKLEAADTHTSAPATTPKVFSAKASSAKASSAKASSAKISFSQVGVNMSGAEFAADKLPGVIGHDMTFNSEASFQYFAKKGIVLFRIGVLWERLQPKLNGPLAPAQLDALKQDISWAKSSGGHVIIDIHNFGRYNLHEYGAYHSYAIDNVYSGPEGLPASVKVPAADFADLWTRLSTEFKNEPAVYGYGLMNEPHDMGSASWKSISQMAVNAIRKNGDTKRILVPGDRWSSAAEWTNTNGPTAWIKDPAKNIMYEAHQYFDHDASGTYTWTYDEELTKDPTLAAVGVRRLTPFITWCNSNRVPGMVGEYGVPKDDPRWLAVMDTALTVLDQAKMPSTVWSAGEWWGDYALSVQPSDNFTRDAPQMPLLIKHGANNHF